MSFDLGQYYSEFGGHNGQFFRRNLFFCIGEDTYDEEIAKFRKDYNNTDIYQCVYSYSNKENIDESLLYGPLYFDLDGDIHNDFEALRHDAISIVTYFTNELGLNHEEINVYFSGAKGFHIIISPFVLGIDPASNLNEIYKAWANYLYETHNIKSLDLKIYDKRRLLRLPGSINSKTGLFKILVSHKLLGKITEEELRARAENPLSAMITAKEKDMNLAAARNFYSKSQGFYDKNKKVGATSSKHINIEEKKELLPCIKYLLEEGVAKGNRNNILSILSNALIQSGYSLEETLDLMHEWNKYNDPPLSFREIEATTRSSYSMVLDGRGYGCSSIKEYGYCVEDCKLLEQEKEVVN